MDSTAKHVDRSAKVLIPSANDKLALILKGHLLVEEILNGILTDKLEIEELPLSPKDGGLSFHQKLKLVQKLAVKQWSRSNTDLLQVVENLNTFRNKLSHRLHEDVNIDAEIAKLRKGFQTATRGTKDAALMSSDSPLLSLIILIILSVVRIRTEIHLCAGEEEDQAEP